MKKSIVALGDLHGRTIWKDIYAQNRNVDIFILMGDYFDSYDVSGGDQLKNFLDICAFKKQMIEKGKEVILLIGNHDHQYFKGINQICYGGYQPEMREKFEASLEENKDLLQMCYMDENEIVYSHAGFTKTFVNNLLGDKFSVEEINEHWKSYPEAFGFSPLDRYSENGDNINQTCIWVRPRSLYNDKIDKKQVVGHTTVNSISHPPKSERRGFYLIDALGTTQEYLNIDDGNISIGRVPKENKKQIEYD